MSEYLLINRPEYDNQLRVSVLEDDGECKFIVTSGYSFAEISWKFYRLKNLQRSDRYNVIQLLNRKESAWLYEILTEINDENRNWSYCEIIGIHKHLPH